ncbi:DinB family protein [Marivirga sp. S37H4]|uniref:DinB family protein n=1 Tax=Marivirga aurantiaca TaxID=2802615 RepID=A0A934X0Q9_9BACT|nr:DinB family protein [Marivirga aurantiaca]MBK6266280.1 DinB family protein [Marivirga aurantiaca]
MKHALFYDRYVNSVTLPINDALKNQLVEIESFLSQLDDEILKFSYADGKWSLKEVLLHCLDVERIMMVRALMISRGESTNLPGFDENAYVEKLESGDITLAQIKSDFKYLRQSNISLLAMTPAEILDKIGEMDNKEVSVASLWFIIVGHWNHHLMIINERYMNQK